ncbi:hypothetical protein AMAG_14438 [Allomyces macrogynus ATCC 38327]|uniref:Cytochrome P450 n=1 Tax=Allomyces macrogynus (strain ATCC 38327) TaxID=578462 RepID=A0A0L0T6A6_ALLM3|nr:hypothetical protein AMAG_14438 [Allomyces macrogynus ATCC 38327]|eukprot:KNE70292.1 hypothetical protein AMAG_14438 [Allomyces macrogynus ATCC 38327]
MPAIFSAFVGATTAMLPATLDAWIARAAASVSPMIRDRTILVAAVFTVALLYAACRLHQFFVPPRALRHLPRAPIAVYLRWILKGGGFLALNDAIMRAVREDALRTGLIASMSDTPRVYLRWFVGVWIVAVSNPDDAKTVFLNHELYEKGRINVGYAREFFGNNVAGAQRQRKVVTRVRAVDHVGDPARHLIAHWDALGVIDPSQWMQRLTLDALSSAAFGHTMDSIHHPDNPMVTTYNRIIHNLFQQGPLLNPLYKLTPGAARLRHDMKAFNNQVFAMIEAKTAERDLRRASGGGKIEDESHRDLLDMMIDAQQGTTFSKEDLRSNTVVFFLAGHETTATALSFALYLLAMHPGVQQRARDEVIQIMGDLPSKPTPVDQVPYPTVEQERQFTFLNCVIKEVMRLYPSAPQLPMRIAMASSTLSDGTHVPAHTHITVDMWALHHAHEYWGDDADKFNPDRWAESVLPDGTVPMQPGARGYTWAPFAGGQRICLGQQFSLVEQRVVLAMMLLRYEWTATQTGRQNMTRRSE